MSIGGKMKRKNKGFTIIELMVVIAIVAILAAVSIPLYDSYRRSAIRTEAMGELVTITASQEDCFNSYRKYCSFDDLVTYYGALESGRHHSLAVTLEDEDQTFRAEVYICYDREGSACTFDNRDTMCFVTNTESTPNCS